MKTLRSDLEDLLKELGLTEELRLYRLRREFKCLFKEPLLSHVYPAALKKGVLTLTVDSNEWLFQLKLQEEKLKKRLSHYNVRAVRFRLGKIPRTKKPPSSENLKESPLPSLPEELKQSISEKVKDPELRQILESTIKKSLKRRG